MGRTRKPVALKVVQGTFRKDRDLMPSAGASMPPLNEVPPAPDWLPNSHAIAEWNRLAPILTGSKILTEGSLSLLAMLCATHGKIVQSFTAGEMPSGALLSALRNMNSDFGITPASQSKVRPAAAPAGANPFLQHGRR